MKSIKRMISCLMIFVICICSLSLVSCDRKYDTDITGEGIFVKMDKVRAEINSKKVEDFERISGKSDYVVLDVENYGKIVLVVREDIAPLTAKNFKKLVASGYYTGLVFHRVIEDFMIQGGGFDVNNRQHESDSVKGEFLSNGVQNKLLHIKGVLSLARTNVMDSGSGQFFIMTRDNETLDGSYAAFGYVLAGLEVVDAIEKCEVDATDPKAPKPITPVVIKEAYFVKYVG